MKRDSKGRFCKDNKKASKEPVFRKISFEEFSRELLGLTKVSKDATERANKLRAQHAEARKMLTMIDAMTAFTIAYPDGDAHSAACQALNALNMCLQLLEIDMQKTCKFTPDPKKHTWWLNSTLCTCPKMDNKDPAYFGRGKIIADDCPVHKKLYDIK